MMFAGAAQRLWEPYDLHTRKAAAPIVILGASLAAYLGLRTILLHVAAASATDCVALDLIAFAGATLLAGVTYPEIPPLLRPLLRGIGGVVLVQVAFDTTTLFYSPTVMVTGTYGLFFGVGAALALAAGALSLRRPAFVLPVLFHYVLFRHQLNIVSGIAVSETDYLSMLDIGAFVTIGALLTAMIARPGVAERLLPAGIDPAWLKATACALIWAWAVGAHFGNYFISGWTKIQAGGGNPLFWLLHNPTQTSILIGLERGDNPLAAWPALVQLSWDAIVEAGIFLNLFVLGVQIMAPLALKRWLGKTGQVG